MRPAGKPDYSEGELFIDSVHRFKGQSAPCIVFTEIDFEELDEAGAEKVVRGDDAGDDEAGDGGVGAGSQIAAGKTSIELSKGLPLPGSDKATVKVSRCL